LKGWINIVNLVASGLTDTKQKPLFSMTPSYPFFHSNINLIPAIENFVSSGRGIKQDREMIGV
jgi:hypothetical protein